MRVAFFVLTLFLLAWADARSRPHRTEAINDIVNEHSGIEDYIILTPVKRRWPDKTLIYDWDATNTHTEEERKNYIKAMQLIADNSCIKFKKLTTETGYVNLKNNAKGCFAFAGYSGKAQILNIEWCLKRTYSIVHEFMHALGFLHEQSRYDRDLYVDVQWEYIGDDFKGAFRKYPRTYAYPRWNYDFESIMHYSLGDVPPTMVLRNQADESKDIGQRNKFSPTDILRLRSAYSCDAASSAIEARSGLQLTEAQRRVAEFVSM